MKKLDKKTKDSIIYIMLHAHEIFKKIRWPDGADLMEVQGVVYTREEFERLKAIWEAKQDLWHIDESELVFLFKLSRLFHC